MTATAEDLASLERLIASLSPEKREELANLPGVKQRLGKWQPNPGPQTDAYYSEADCLLYGGEPGGGKSQLILGLAFNEHQRSFIMRREYGDLERLIEDALKINGGRDGFNGSPPPRLRTKDDRLVYFRAAHRVGDEQGTMGQGRDLLGIDEATQFAESQVRFLMGWVRTEVEGQRTRTVLATNPPLSAQGLWVTKMFAPWLDPKYPNPAQPGELRWVISDEDGRDLWVSGPDDVREIAGKVYKPTSRTFIPASVKDNPYYVDTDYQRQLDAMPEPYRSLLMGGFKTLFRDDENQVIPTAWIKAAQDRWKPDGFKDFSMTAIAIDPAGGGEDAQEIAYRHGGWYGPIATTQGEQTRDGSQAVAQLITRRRHGAPVVVDVGAGYGDKVTLLLSENEIPFIAFNGSNKATGQTKDGKLRFANKRAEAWWRFREELDPQQEGGSVIALPDDPELLADLASPTFEITTRGILLESKVDIKDRLGRSPGKGDAVVMCLTEGHAAVRRELGRTDSIVARESRPAMFKRKPTVHLGYANAKKGRR